MYNDPVNHPAHYTSGSVECIDAMVSAFGAAQVAVYAKIAAFKYLWRADTKAAQRTWKRPAGTSTNIWTCFSGGDDHDTV